MTSRKIPRIRRRGFLAALLSIPAVAILYERVRHTAYDDVVEIDGWILRRSDIEGGET